MNYKNLIDKANTERNKQCGSDDGEQSGSCKFKRLACAKDKQRYIDRFVQSQDTCADYRNYASPRGKKC